MLGKTKGELRDSFYFKIYSLLFFPFVLQCHRSFAFFSFIFFFFNPALPQPNCYCVFFMRVTFRSSRSETNRDGHRERYEGRISFGTVSPVGLVSSSVQYGDFALLFHFVLFCLFVVRVNTRIWEASAQMEDTIGLSVSCERGVL
jgi:hypothetical protein